MVHKGDDETAVALDECSALLSKSGDGGSTEDAYVLHRSTRYRESGLRERRAVGTGEGVMTTIGTYDAY